ncbi:MAG: segregation/condensation protein A [Elusimicrobia bacterium HGW-Elusimicrobia-3]|nr:MAG: segregation/condensation protein A [Elusimicrobia bacterium HGW-Elusimicrobia-3]
MSAIDIHLENFEGPLDLLMHLIKKNNLDIYDIPISQITAEYLQYLEVMKSLNLDVAGDFLVMAATLMQIKAKMLLPAPEAAEGENGPDPRGALVSMLEEYQRYKEASKEMNTRFSKFKDAFYRGSPVFTSEEKYLDLDFYALMDAVKRAFERAEPSREVEADQFPIESRVAKIEKMLEGRDWLILDEIFASEKKRLGVITCFMALLELIKQHKIVVSQDEAYSEVRIYPAPVSVPAPEPAAVAAAPEQPAVEAAPQPESPEPPPGSLN